VVLAVVLQDSNKKGASYVLENNDTFVYNSVEPVQYDLQKLHIINEKFMKKKNKFEEF
jgi:hypothetical protein